ncbi:MAG: hypothetical protein OEN23_06720 [Paracoccaceae bacterium]|nr:hypothetical protein [Paracoccaceae bacterium]
MAVEKRKIEIFSAGCGVCLSAVEQIKQEACASCDVEVLDMNDPGVKRRADELGIGSLPAIVIEGKLADCCASRSIDLGVLRKAGLGRSLR